MKKRWMSSGVATVLFAACLVTSCTFVPPETGAAIPPATPRPLPPSQTSQPPIRYVQPHGEVADQVIAESNLARHTEGLAPLSTSTGANRAAMAYAQELAARKEISHTSPARGLEDPGSRLAAAGVSWTRVAENLALFSPRVGIAEHSIKGWLNSAGHRRNLLNPVYTITGAGVATDERGNYYIVQIYATQ